MPKKLPFRVLLVAALFPLSVLSTFAGVSSAARLKHTVTLQTILSCADDSLLNDVFNTDSLTAEAELNAVAMMLRAPNKDTDVNLHYASLRAKGFITVANGDSNLTIWATDYLGQRIKGPDRPFCRSELTAHYEKLGDRNARPSMMEIDGEQWLLDPNELFVHADQFRFESGVFSSSPDSFLMATKGRVSVQFVCKPGGLKFYRAFVYPKE